MPVGDSAAQLSQGKTSRMTTRICLRAKNASSTSEIDMKSAKLICCVWSFVLICHFYAFQDEAGRIN